MSELEQQLATTLKDRVELFVAGKEGWELRELLPVPRSRARVVLRMPAQQTLVFSVKKKYQYIRGNGGTMDLAYHNLVEKLATRGFDIL